MVTELGRERLDLLQTIRLIRLASYVPDIYRVNLQLEGASIQSTLYVKSIDAGATLKASYYQWTTGAQDQERQLLDSHPVITSADVPVEGLHHVLSVSRIHDKPYLEVDVSGGNAEFGIYITIKSDFTSDIDAALVLDGETWLPDSTKGIPIACLDAETGDLGLVRCTDGKLSLTDQTGAPFHVSATKLVDGSTQDLIDYEVPSQQRLSLRKIDVTSRQFAKWQLLVDGVLTASGRTGPNHTNSFFVFSTPQLFSAGQNILLQFRSSRYVAGSDVDAYINGNIESV